MEIRGGKMLRIPHQLAAILLLFALGMFCLTSSPIAPSQSLFDSPLPTPPLPTPTLPAPTPTPLPSAEAQIALRYISEQYDIPVEELIIANEHDRQYAELGRAFRAFVVMEPQGKRRFFDLLVNLEDHTVVEDIAAVEQAEQDARRQKYGKLEPALYDRLQKAAEDELIEVSI